MGVAEFVACEIGRLLERFERAAAMERLYWETLASVTSALARLTEAQPGGAV